MRYKVMSDENKVSDVCFTHGKRMGAYITNGANHKRKYPVFMGGRASVAPTKFLVICIQNRVIECPVRAWLARPC